MCGLKFFSRCAYGFFGAIRMTLEAVDGYCGILMAIGAKMLFRIAIAGVFALLIGRYMAVNATGKTMLFGAYTMQHGFVALVQDKFKMHLAHHVSRFDTLFSIRRWHLAFIISKQVGLQQ